VKITICGFPAINGAGGATGEALHAALLWRRNGLDVQWVPTWGSAAQETVDMLASYGMDTIISTQRDILDVPGLRGSFAVAFCNDKFTRVVDRLRQAGVKVCFCPLMCYWRAGWQTTTVDALVCQSEFQRSRLRRPDAHLIRGAFDWANAKYEPRPRLPGEPFVVGRLGRDAASKWHWMYWRMCEEIPNCRALTMGFNSNVLQQARPKPEWASAMPVGSMPAEQFYRQLHAYLNMGEEVENWPRVGLEAMAYGVPVIAENRGGWAEMIQHGVNGLLFDPAKPLEGGKLAAELAADEPRRLALAESARRHLETVLAEPGAIWDGWKGVFGV